MDEKLHEKYKDLKLSEEVSLMFLDILVNQEPLAFSVLVEIGRNNKLKKQFGIQHLADSIKVNRKVRKINQEKKVYFAQETTTLNRKHAERIVDKLAAMSLIYTVNESFYKLLFLTPRGRSLLNTYMKQKTAKSK